MNTFSVKEQSVNTLYRELLRSLIEHGHKVGNTLELRNVLIDLGHGVYDPQTFIVTLKDRNLSIEYLIAELVWYFSGDNSMKFISKFGSMWEKLSDDGVTNNSAYGYILKKKHDFDQIEKVIELLKKDPNSRRAVININEANPNVIETKDEPCTIAIQFLLRGTYLDVTSMMRSNDIWFGFPYDIVFFTALRHYVAKRLNASPGLTTHFVTSLHLYEKDFGKASQIVLMNRLPDRFEDRFCLNIDLLIEKAKEIRDSIDENNFTQEEFMDLIKKHGIYYKGEKKFDL